MKSEIERMFFLGFIRLHILHHACIGEVYGAQMMEELTRHGYELSYGTLYPVLHNLETAGLLTSEKRTDRGRQRRYYAATGAGKQALLDARAKIRELVDELLEGADTAKPKTSRGGEGDGLE